MAAVWSDAHRLATWLDVELAATEAREKGGDVPAGTAARIRARARVNPARMLEIEAEVEVEPRALSGSLARSLGFRDREALTRAVLRELLVRRMIDASGHQARGRTSARPGSA